MIHDVLADILRLTWGAYLPVYNAIAGPWDYNGVLVDGTTPLG